MEIIATPIRGKDLKPGELFSSVGPLYWMHYANSKSIGEKVYIRTSQVLSPQQEEEEIYKITILQ